MDLRDAFRVLWKSRFIIIGIFVMSVLVAGVMSFTTPPTYRASCIVDLGNFNDTAYTDQAAAIAVIMSSEYLLDVMEQLKAGASDEDDPLASFRVGVDPVKDSYDLLIISVETEKREEAKKIVDTVVSLFAERSGESYHRKTGMLSEQLAITQNLLKIVENDINKTREVLKNIEDAPGASAIERELRISRTLDYLNSAESRRLTLLDRELDLEKRLALMKGLEVVQEAKEPASPIRTNNTLMVSVAGILGLMTGVFIAFLRDALGRPRE